LQDEHEKNNRKERKDACKVSEAHAPRLCVSAFFLSADVSRRSETKTDYADCADWVALFSVDGGGCFWGYAVDGDRYAVGFEGAGSESNGLEMKFFW
jgi:hypothetical protein